MCIRDSFYRVQARSETLAQYVQRIREVARILGMGMSEEEVVQHILDGGCSEDRLRLVFAELPRWFADLDRLWVMTKATQMSDHARGDGRGEEPRPQRSEGPKEPFFPRQAQPARNREQTKAVICYNCNLSLIHILFHAMCSIWKCGLSPFFVCLPVRPAGPSPVT